MKIGKWWSNLKIARKIQIVGLVIVALFCLQYLLIFPDIKANLLDEHKDRVKHVVEVAYGTIAYYGELARKGEVSTSEAKELAAKAISQTRYDENEYFWI